MACHGTHRIVAWQAVGQKVGTDALLIAGYTALLTGEPAPAKPPPEHGVGTEDGEAQGAGDEKVEPWSRWDDIAQSPFVLKDEYRRVALESLKLDV